MFEAATSEDTKTSVNLGTSCAKRCEREFGEQQVVKTCRKTVSSRIGETVPGQPRALLHFPAVTSTSDFLPYQNPGTVFFPGHCLTGLFRDDPQWGQSWRF